MHLAHPLSIATSQIIIDRHHVHATAGEGIEIARQGRNKGLALSCLHLTDLTLMQHHATDQLHIEMAHAKHTLTRLTHHSEGFWEQLI